MNDHPARPPRFGEFYHTGNPVYTAKSLEVATFFGGPLVAGYMLSANFRAFDHKSAARMALLHGTLGTVFLFAALLAASRQEWYASIPGPLVGAVIPGLYTAVAALFLQKYQGPELKAHLAAGGATHSRWRAAMVSVAGILLTLVILAGLSLLQPAMEGKRIELRDTKSTVFYTGMGEAEARTVADTLLRHRHFDLNPRTYLKVQRTVDGYKFLFPAESRNWGSPAVRGYFASLLVGLDSSLAPKRCRAYLFQDGYNGRDSMELKYADDPLYSWMKRPDRPLSDSLMIARLIHEISFWKALFAYAAEHGEEHIYWANIPLALWFSPNEVAVLDKRDIDRAWFLTFCSPRDATRVYRTLRWSIEGVDWQVSANPCKSSSLVLEGMIARLQELQAVGVEVRAKEARTARARAR